MKENNVEYIKEGYFDGLEIYISGKMSNDSSDIWMNEW